MISYGDSETTKYYRGIPEGNGYDNVGEVTVHCKQEGTFDRSYPLDPRYDLYNHSPTGFAWGYGGSGPAQLALAMLADATDDELARKHYQQFKSEVIAKLKHDTWDLPAGFILGWIDGKELPVQDPRIGVTTTIRPDGITVHTLEPGNVVLCDDCCKDFTESDQEGGMLFQSKAIGPCCASKWRTRARNYDEQRFIRGQCPPDMTFANWVRDIVRA